MSVHLVIGASGQVGGHLIDAIMAAGHEAIGTYCTHSISGMRQLDIRNYVDVLSLMMEVRPAVVYLPAALSNVDYCELHPHESYKTNVIGVRNVVRSVDKVGAKFVYFSSDYIFDGKDGPYREFDVANPICEYGRQKLLAEHYIMLRVQNYLIIRTTVVYGWERQGKNFICWLLRALGEGRVVDVPTDQIGSPTYAPNLARAVVQLVTLDMRHVYHVAGPACISRYRFAHDAAKVFGLDSDLIQPVITSELGQVALRPLCAGMVIEKVAAELTFPLIGHYDGLKDMAQKGRSTRCKED